MSLKIRIKNFTFQLLFQCEGNVKSLIRIFLPFSALNSPFSAISLVFSYIEFIMNNQRGMCTVKKR